jgi:hypothetical protein
MRRGKKRLFVAFAAVAVLGLAGSAYTNANTFASEPKAGAGSQAISGYDISNVHYDLNASDPQNIDSIDFELDGEPAASATIKYRLSAGGSWSGDCAHVNSGGTATVSDCTAPGGSTVVDTTELTVVVAD